MRTKSYAFLICFLSYHTVAFAQKDTLRVMAYNVMNFGKQPLCQAPLNAYYTYLDTIIRYTNPDIISLEKMGSVKFSSTDASYSAPIGFADSIVSLALNAAFPNRYAYCPFTNYSATDNMSVLFYNKNKLGFLSLVSSYDNITDFNTYKLYYKDPNLATTHDTTFLYFILNHDQSGSDPTSRNAQIIGEMQLAQIHFRHLPNMLNMGDFNTRNTSETCYQTLVNPTDTNYRFYDPPFYPDHTLTYPVDYDGNPASCAKFLTTTTRRYGNIPNTCGTNGGAKGWYDHIFVSPWIVNNLDYVRYIPNSYRAVGNDGNRMSFSINDSTPIINTSAPATVLNALFQMSDKYPVMVDLEVSYNTTGTGPTDPEVPEAVATLSAPKEQVYVVNPVGTDLTIGFSQNLQGKNVVAECYNVYGQLILRKEIHVAGQTMQIPANINRGIYFLKLYDQQNILYSGSIIKR